LSEALIFASTNPQYDDRLFIELQVQYMKILRSNLGRTCYVQKLFPTFRTIFAHNMFSPCSAKRRASDKDLPVQGMDHHGHETSSFQVMSAADALQQQGPPQAVMVKTEENYPMQIDQSSVQVSDGNIQVLSSDGSMV
jgi:hypothetical protein